MRRADRDGHADGLALEDEAALLDLLAQPLGQRARPLEVGLRQDDGELLAAVAREHLVAADALLDEARHLLEDVVAGEVAVDVVDLLEVVDVEHEEAEIALVTPRAHDLLLERLEQVPLHVHLRETIDDGHPVDLFVVLRLDVLPGQELEDGRADLDAVAVGRGAPRA